MGALGAVIALIICAYLYVLPWAAERVAEGISPATETALGDEVLDWMDRSGFIYESDIDPRVRYRLLGRFAEMTRGLPQERYYTLVFRDSYGGPNAFALPGGTIVLLDDMIEAAHSDEEILSVLAHEIGHIERRHATRNILQQSVVTVAAMALTADASSLGTVVGGFPLLVSQMKYSRDFEREADDFGFILMRRHGLSPTAFADLMERVQKQEGEESDSDFLSSHPLTSERIARARAAARELPPGRQP